jgi:hypothetical protein
MRKALRSRLSGATLAVFFIVPRSLEAAPGAGRVTVGFLQDGRCTVTADGEGFHSALTYKPPNGPQGQEFRCAIPPVPAGRPVELRVTLPPGARPAGTDAPGLDWEQRDGVWVGRAIVSTSPEVVVVTEWGSPAAVRARWIRRAAVVVGIVLFAALGRVWWRRRLRLRRSR